MKGVYPVSHSLCNISEGLYWWIVHKLCVLLESANNFCERCNGWGVTLLNDNKKRNKKKWDTVIDQYGNVTDPAAKANLLFRNFYPEDSKSKVVTCFLSTCIGENGL